MENESGFVKQVKLCGAEIPEVREKISDLLTAQDAAKIDLEGAFGEVMIKISSDGENARETVKAAVRELKVRFGSSIYTTKKSVSLEQTIVDLLKEQQMTVSTVESCTGGMISARLTDVPGCSEVFRQGFVTYSDRAKRKMVGVKKSTLKKYTIRPIATAVLARMTNSFVKYLFLSNEESVSLVSSALTKSCAFVPIRYVPSLSR